MHLIRKLVPCQYEHEEARYCFNDKKDRGEKQVCEDFEDGAHIIYVNSKRQDDTELGQLMHDLHCKDASDMNSKVLAERVRELKETQEGVEFMCREMEQIYSEGIEEGIEKGIEKGELKKAKDTALSMALDGMKIDKIAQYLKVNPKLVQEWIGETVIE